MFQPKLLAHFRAMQTCVANYLPPESYTPQFGDTAGVDSHPEGPAKEAAFVGDMIWALDGPEQREAQAEAEWDYIAETDLTASDVFGGDNSDAVMLSRALKNFIDASKELDKHKKVLFRKRSPSEAGLPPRGPKALPTSLYFQGRDSELLHGIIGIATESGELAEVAWGRMVLGKPVDVVNVREEIGDILWYVARLLRWATSDFLTEMRRNIAKLRSRHGTKGFNAAADANRDLSAERAVLESDRDPNTADMFDSPDGEPTFTDEEVAASNEMTGGQCFDGPKRGDPVEPPFGARANTATEGFDFPDDPHCRDA